MVIYDKLRNMQTDETKFNFICPHCKANGMKKKVFTIKPLGISWRPDKVDNSDLSLFYRRKYNSLPTLREALLMACNKNNETVNIVITCNKCNNPIQITEKIDLPIIRKWLNINTKEPFFIARKKEVDKDVIRKRKSRIRQ